MTSDVLKCPLCASPSLTAEFLEESERRRDGTTLSFSVPITVCAECGQSFATPEQARAGDIARADALRELDAALAPTAIVALRGKLGLTQAEFERYLGIGQKTVVRWEAGTVVPNRTADLLMRVLAEVPEARAFCSQHSGVSIASTAQPEFATAPSNRAGYFIKSVAAPILIDHSSVMFDQAAREAARHFITSSMPAKDLLVAGSDAASFVAVESGSEESWRPTQTGEFRSPLSLLRNVA